MSRSLLPLLALGFAFASSACGGDNPQPDASDEASIDATVDVPDVHPVIDTGLDAQDALPDIPVDVPPASLPGRWRLVGFENTSAGGATLSLTDVDAYVRFGGQRRYGRVNGTTSLAADRFESMLSVLFDGHVYTLPTAGSASDAMSIFATASSGTLGAATFSPASGTPITFSTNADGTISASMNVGAFGLTRLTWARADALPSPAGLSSQGNVIRLQPDTAALLVHPRVAIAWDRPGPGTGYTFTNDMPAVFAGGGNLAAITLLVTYVLPEYTASFGDTTLSLGYLVVYDDVDGDGRFDPPGASGDDAGFDAGDDASSAGDAATIPDAGVINPGGGDPVRGVSRIVITVRSIPPASSVFAASPFRDVGGGVRFGTWREDPTATGGISVGSFDTTHSIPPDAVVEAVGTHIPDLL